MPKLFGKRLKFTNVPIDFITQARTDADNFSRDLLGVPTLSLKPLFDDISKVYSCVDKSLVNPFSENTLTLLDSFRPEINKKYYIHLDGSEGGDGYGICMASLSGWTTDQPSKQVVKIDLLGSPSRRTYGREFKPEFVEDIVKELVDRGFFIQILTYDRATIIRDLRPVIENQGGIVEPMSLDRCANYPLVDYDKPEPPYLKTESTQGSYFMPMTNFRDIINRGGLIVPYHESWFKIPYAFEINMNKKIVSKIQGKLDDLGQACAGAVFHVLNNEKDQTQGIKGLVIEDKPDSFMSLINELEDQLNKPSKKIDTFDYEPEEIPDEISVDDFNERINNKYYY